MEMAKLPGFQAKSGIRSTRGFETAKKAGWQPV
jgi:hypothetical protein